VTPDPAVPARGGGLLKRLLGGRKEP
jgi:hypothetical protein